MKQAFSLLFKENLASWFRARGFVLVLVAALVPAGLTGAWVYTVEGDIVVTGIEWEPEGPTTGEPVNITVSLENRFPRDAPAFEVAISVGHFRGSPVDPDDRTWRGVFSERVQVDGLASGESTTVQTTWTPGENHLGTFLVEAVADPDEEMRDADRLSNFLYRQMQVQLPAGVFEEIHEDEAGDSNETAEAESGNAEAPETQEGPTDNSTLPQVDLRVREVRSSSTLYEGEPVDLTASVQNRGPDDLSGGHVEFLVERLRVYTIEVDGQQFFQGEWVEVRSDRVGFDAVAGQTVQVEHSFTPNVVTDFRITTMIDIEGVAHDPDTSGHTHEQVLNVDRRLPLQDPPEGESAKAFYQDLVLDWIHLKLLIPLIALFYAGGVLSDERRKNTLAYLFTRPMPRWLLPVVRFSVSFVIAAVAVAVGVLAVNAILLGQPGADWEYLWWPLGLTLGTLFVYGAVFTLLGVFTNRPYLWGMLYVIGFEGMIFFARRLLVNDRPFFQTWTEYLSLHHWVLQVFSGWNPDRVLDPWWGESSAMVAGIGLVVIAVAAIIASAMVIQRRDLEV
jgi:ABC-type transport system involved in multi-copper enzyme maturation permease subunit